MRGREDPAGTQHVTRGPQVPYPLGMDRRLLIVLFAVFCLALLLRVVFVLECADSDYAQRLVLDSSTYHKIAVEGDPRGPYWQPPLYPWFLRGVYRAVGQPSPEAVRLLQALLGALSCVGVSLIVRRFASLGASAAAGVAAALCGSLIYFDGEILPASLATFLLTAWILVTLTPGRPKGVWGRLRWPVSGLLLGVLGLLLPSLALVGLPSLVYLARREGPRPAFVVALVAAALIAPISARNYHFEDELVAVSWNGGINFWIGNNPDYPRTVGIRPGIEWQQLSEKPRCEGRARSRAAESRWFFARGFRYLREHPLAWLGDELTKIPGVLGGREIGRNRELYDARRDSVVLRVLLWKAGFPFLVILACGSIGLAALWRERRIPGLLLLVVLGVLAASLVFFPTARYRAPALPALIALAAIGLPRLKRRDLPAGLVAVGLGLVPVGIPEIPRSETLYEIGVDLEQSGRPLEAIPFFEEALSQDPESADLHLVYGLALSRSGDLDGARQQLARAVDLDPGADVGWQSLAMLSRRDGDLAGAAELMQRAIEANPCNRRVRASYAEVLIDQGYYRAAREQLDEARRIYARRDSVVEQVRQRLDQLEGRR